MSSIFISYNHKNIEKVKVLSEDIEKLGHKVWYDQELSGGQVWWDRILEEIRKCDVFIYGLDNDSLDSAYCNCEFTYALDLEKPILPIWIQEDVSLNILSPALSKFQTIEYYKRDTDATIQLVKALDSQPPAKPLPESLPSPPPPPVSILGNLYEQVKKAENLSFEKQSAVLIESKGLLNNKKITSKVINLLEKFRKRHDVYESIAKELDELIITAKRLSSIQDTVEQIRVSSRKDKTDLGKGFYLLNLYKRISRRIEIRLLRSRWENMPGIDNVLAYYNSENSLRDSLTRIYHRKYPQHKASKMINIMKGRLDTEVDFMNRKRVGAILIMKELDREAMKAE